MKNYEFRECAYPVVFAAVIIILWSSFVQTGLIPESVLPSPIAVWRAAVEDIQSGLLFVHISSSLGRLLAGFLIGATLGVLIGGVMSQARIINQALSPIIEILRPVPPLAWVPLSLIWFGLGEPSKLFLVALAVGLPVVVATFKGMSQVDPTILRAALALDVRPIERFFLVVLPASLPDIAAGLRLGLSLGVTMLVGAEMIAAPSGVGYMIIDAMNAARPDRIVLGILLLGVIGLATDSAFELLMKGRFLRWHVGISAATA
ncbi:ABC transporter permease [Parapusillimonas sp. SGNA-6]|nr:ABC transporter permease [Parapusillimonas sp. SGNA-6]